MEKFLRSSENVVSCSNRNDISTFSIHRFRYCVSKNAPRKQNLQVSFEDKGKCLCVVTRTVSPHLISTVPGTM